VRVGLLRLDRIPHNTPILELRGNRPLLTQIVICPDSCSIESASPVYARHVNAPWPTEEESEGKRLLPSSRYRTFPVAEDKPDRIIFINSSALEASDVRFLLNFLSELYRHLTDAESLETKGLQKAILDGELEQHHRLGLPFALVGTPTKQIMRAAHEMMIIAWAEMSTLRSIAPKEDCSAVAKFVSDRIAIFEEALKGKFEDVVLTGILTSFSCCIFEPAFC